ALRWSATILSSIPASAPAARTARASRSAWASRHCAWTRSLSVGRVDSGLSFRGARQSPKGEGAANPESITPVCGYGFRLSPQPRLGRNDESYLTTPEMQHGLRRGAVILLFR